MVVEKDQLFRKATDVVQEETSADVMRTILGLILSNRKAEIVINMQSDFVPYIEFESLRKLLSLLSPERSMSSNTMMKNYNEKDDFVPSISKRNVGYIRLRQNGLTEVDNKIANKDTHHIFVDHKDKLSSFILSSNRLMEFVGCHEIPFDWYRSSILCSIVEVPLVQVFYGTKLTSGSMYEFMYSRAVAEESITGEKRFFVL